MSKGNANRPEPKLGYEQAGFFSRLTYHFVEPLIRLGVRQQIEEHTSDAYLPRTDTAEKLSADFDAAYAAVQVGLLAGRAGCMQQCPRAPM